jgi:TonB family protein
MIKAFMLIFLTMCVYLPGLFAQEMPGQGWGSSAPRRPTNEISITATQSTYDPSLSSSETLISGTVERKKQEGSRAPFPILTPKAIVYPRKAVHRGWEGQTVVAAEVLPDGSVGRTALAKSSGHEVLDQAAKEAIQSWKFETELEKDQAVPQYVDIPVTFKLQSED